MKIIQIAVAAMPATLDHHDFSENLYALTDDGRLFRRTMTDGEDAKWAEIDAPAPDSR